MEYYSKQISRLVAELSTLPGIGAKSAQRLAFHILDMPVEDILRFQNELFEYIDTKYPEIPESIVTNKVMDEETEAKLVKAIEECKASFR